MSSVFPFDTTIQFTKKNQNFYYLFFFRFSNFSPSFHWFLCCSKVSSRKIQFHIWTFSFNSILDLMRFRLISFCGSSYFNSNEIVLMPLILFLVLFMFSKLKFCLEMTWGDGDGERNFIFKLRMPNMITDFYSKVFFFYFQAICRTPWLKCVSALAVSHICDCVQMNETNWDWEDMKKRNVQWTKTKILKKNVKQYLPTNEQNHR